MCLVIRRKKLQIETRKIEQLGEANSTCGYPTFYSYFCLLYKLPEIENTQKTDNTINVKCVKNVFVGSAIWTLLSEKHQCPLEFNILEAIDLQLSFRYSLSSNIA